jgi:DnaJ-class molecular chaperone
MSPAPARSDDSDNERRICTPCRGTGRLISSLGGDPHEITCPWCGGTGEFAPGRDAQRVEPPESPN